MNAAANPQDALSLSAILAVKPKRQSSFIVHEVGLQNTNDMQDNRNECKG